MTIKREYPSAIKPDQTSLITCNVDYYLLKAF
jgi:hypothetical protein